MRKYFFAPALLLIPILAIALMASVPQATAQNETAPFLEGKFPMAMYAVPATDDNFEAVRSMGINYVHLYGLTKDPLDEAALARIQQYLDLAEKHQLKVMLDLDGSRRVPGKLDAMRTVVQRFKNHPALGFWYLFDEPDNKKLTAKDLAPFYEMIKAESPDIPVAVCHAWTTHWYAFNDVQDILMQDTYPVSGAPFPEARLDIQTRFTKGAMKIAEGKPVMPVLQFFNWRSMAKPEDKEYRKYPVEKLRYPNAQEMRYLCFSTIAQGAEGLGFYSYMRSVMTDPQWGKTIAAPVLLDVRKFTDQLNGSKPEHLTTGEDEKAILTRWKGKDATYLILVNASPETRRMEYSVDLPANATLQNWGKTRDASAIINNGKISVEQANPWEIFIWRVEN